MLNQSYFHTLKFNLGDYDQGYLGLGDFNLGDFDLIPRKTIKMHVIRTQDILFAKHTL